MVFTFGLKEYGRGGLINGVVVRRGFTVSGSENMGNNYSE